MGMRLSARWRDTFCAIAGLGLRVLEAPEAEAEGIGAGIRTMTRSVEGASREEEEEEEEETHMDRLPTIRWVRVAAKRRRRRRRPGKRSSLLALPDYQRIAQH